MGLLSPYPDNWHELRQKVKDRDDHECQICGANSEAELHVHHIVPLFDGGSNSLSNLVTLCWSCHNDQHNNDVSRNNPSLSAGGVNNRRGTAPKIPQAEGKWKEGEGPIVVPTPLDQSGYEPLLLQIKDYSNDTSEHNDDKESQSVNINISYTEAFAYGLLADVVMLMFISGNIVTAFIFKNLLFGSAEVQIANYALSGITGVIVFSTIWQVTYDYLVGIDHSVVRETIEDYVLIFIFFGGACIPAISFWFIFKNTVWLSFGGVVGVFMMTIFFGFVAAYEIEDASNR